MHEVQTLGDRLFPAGHDLRHDGPLVCGVGRLPMGEVAVVGTTASAAIGVELAFALAERVLDVVTHHPGRPILMLVDTQGQQLSRRDELLGNAGYLAHLSTCFELARARGHRLVSLVSGEAVSGGYLALGMIADHCFALASAHIRVMALPAMARITQIPLERLEDLCTTSPIFGPGVENYLRLGALEAVWPDQGPLDLLLQECLSGPAPPDVRARRGLELGGRVLAGPVARRVAGLQG